MIDVVAFGYRPWTHVATSGVNVRDLHLTTELSKLPEIGKIIYISRPVSFPERVLRRTPWRPRGSRKLAEFSGFELSQDRQFPKIYPLSGRSSDILGPLIEGRAWWDVACATKQFMQAVDSSLQKLRTCQPALLSWTPFAPSVYENVAHASSVFDVIDNFSVHARIGVAERKACVDGYRRIGKMASYISAVSEKAARAFDESSVPKIVIRNGVPRTWLNLAPERPADFPHGGSRPVVGCGGYFFRKFRADVLVDCARRMPDVDFVLLGAILDRAIEQQIARQPNVFFLGFRHYEALSAYYYHFDAGLILYDMELENDGDPLKLYEYLAVGTPVVSLPSMGISETPGAIAVVASGEELADVLTETLRREREERRVSCRRVLTDQDFWDSKAAVLAGLLSGMQRSEAGRA